MPCIARVMESVQQNGILLRQWWYRRIIYRDVLGYGLLLQLMILLWVCVQFVYYRNRYRNYNWNGFRILSEYKYYLILRIDSEFEFHFPKDFQVDWFSLFFQRSIVPNQIVLIQSFSWSKAFALTNGFDIYRRRTNYLQVQVKALDNIVPNQSLDYEMRNPSKRSHEKIWNNGWKKLILNDDFLSLR